MTESLSVPCPTCKNPVAWVESNGYRPFCSKRCQMIDLGAWASEEHKIEGVSLLPEGIELPEGMDIRDLLDPDADPGTGGPL